MAGYIGSKVSVTQVDGYNRSEADAEFVQVSGDTMNSTLLAGNVARNVDGIRIQSNQSGTSYGLRIGSDGSTDPLEFWRQHSNGDQKQFSVDYFGRVTMPYQPAFHAMAGNFNNISSGNLIYNSVTFNTGNHYNSSTGNFTAPVAGVYQFHASCYSQSGTGTSVSAKITVNGVMRQIGEIAETGGNYGFDGINMSVIVYLNVNDVVAAQYRAGGQLHLNGSNNSFSGALIG